MSQSKRSYYRRLYHCLRPYRGAMLRTVVMVLVLSGTGLLIPSVIRWGLAAVRTGEGGGLLLQVLLLIALYPLMAAAQYGLIYWGHVVGYSVVADLRQMLYAKLQSMCRWFYNTNQTGDLVARASADIYHVENLTAHALPQVIQSGLYLVGVPLVLMMINWNLALFSLAPVPFLIIATRRFGRKLTVAAREHKHEHARMVSLISDHISGMSIIQAFTREPDEARRFDECNRSITGVQMRHMRLSGVWAAVAMFLTHVGYVIGLYFGGRLVLGGTLVIEDLLAFMLYVGLFYGPVIQIQGVIEQLVDIRSGIERVFQVLDQEPVVVDRPGAQSPSAIDGTVEFQEVRFGYDTGSEVLRGINLRVEPGKMLALVGVSGSGKSTMACLIPRFYDVGSGSVKVGGYDVRDLTLRTLREHVSVVLQDTFLFNTTVAENIAYGKRGASFEQIEQAARQANAHSFITALPDGYDTITGERGVLLSGGQRQRISLARAILKDAPILVLDEATSAVDTETEQKIQQAIDRLIRTRTTVVIAHRLSTVRNADEICVVHEGEIVERGTHDNLLRTNGPYRHLYNTQFHTQERREQSPVSTKSQDSVHRAS